MFAPEEVLTVCFSPLNSYTLAQQCSQHACTGDVRVRVAGWHYHRDTHEIAAAQDTSPESFLLSRQRVAIYAVAPDREPGPGRRRPPR